MKNVISYCLFESHLNNMHFYYSYAIPALCAARCWFPDWEIRVHHDSYIEQELLNISKNLDIKLVKCEDDRPLCENMLWRLKPLWDENVNFVICRDLDSVITPRERYAVQEFINLDGTCHNLAELPQHNTCLMGGLCGFSGKEFRKNFKNISWNNLIASHKLTVKGSDQTFLRDIIWPKMNSNSVEHRTAGIIQYPVVHKLNNPDFNIQVNCVVHKNSYDAVSKLTHYAGQAGFDRNKIYDFYSNLLEKIPKISSKKYVVFSSNINPTFDFFLPLTGYMWKRLGFEPLIYLVGPESEWKEKRHTIINALTRECVSNIKYIDYIPPVKSHSIAQVIRLYAFCDIPGDEYITSDADIWPLAEKEFWARTDPSVMKTWNFKGNPEYFMCYVSGRSGSWRNLMRILTPSTSREELIKQLKAGPGLDPNLNWCYDQTLLSSRLNESKEHRESSQRTPGDKYLPNGRIDRLDWKFDGNKAGLVDAHLLRPGWTDANWARILKMFITFCPELETWANEYRNAYVKEIN